MTDQNNSFHISEIIPERLYLGDRYAAHSEKTLRSRKIDVVVNTAKGLENKFLIEFQYQNFRINDTLSENILSHLENFCKFVDESRGKRVFVHCVAGVSRSASFVISYVMWHNKWSYKKAFEFVRTKRNCVYPNENFEKQLMEWEKKILGEE